MTGIRQPDAGEQATPETESQVSEEQNQDVAAESSTAETDVQADTGESSAPEGEKDTRQSLMDVVEAATSGATEETAEGASPGPEEGSQEAKSEEEAPTEGTETAADSDTEDDAGIDFDDAEATEKWASEQKAHTRKRIDKLLRERAEYREDATQFRQIQSFMDENGLSPEMTAEALQTAAVVRRALRGDVNPSEALKAVDQYREQLVSLTGEKLPADLQQKVSDGEMEASAAQELARERARRETLERARSEDQQRYESKNQQTLAAAARNAVAQWDQTIRSRDPDYEKKQSFVLARVKAIAASEGPPKTPDAAVQLAQRAYKEVSDELSQFMPKPEPKAPSPAPETQTTAPVTREPRSLKEAVDMGLQRAHS